LEVSEKNIIFSTGGILGDFRQVDTDGLRNEEPLTEEQYALAKAYAVLLGMPEGSIRLADGETGYLSGFDILKIGTDVLPLGNRSKNPNSNLSLKGSIAHEIVGHRDAYLGGFTQGDNLLEEVQASIRAARFAPDLNRQERIDLIKDGIYRLYIRGKSIRNVKNNLHISKR
jgi:hypothetical protein